MSVRVIQAITSVRVGDGSAVGALDLPVARERHTRWPFIPGSALKGALRDHTSQTDADAEHLVAVFGSAPPEPGSDDDDDALSAGSVHFGPAVLLAMPVRSLKGTFVLLTCPTALARFGRALGRSTGLPTPGPAEALIAPKQADKIGERAKGNAIGQAFAGVVWLEEVDLVGVLDESVAAWADVIRGLTGDDSPLSALAVVHDDVFAHAARAWTELRTRNAVGDDGVVEDKKLFSVEMMPAETLWWSTIDGDDRGLLPKDGESFGIGGHRSVGLGLVTWFGGQA